MPATIREIKREDNPAIAGVIRTVLIEHNVPKVGTAYADASLDWMFEKYDDPKSVYYVIEENAIIAGGAGIAPLDNGPDDVCELQKMYFLAQSRGKGLGEAMISQCLAEARKLGFRRCYLETMPYMEKAQRLYLKCGFRYLDAPMGDTGHTECPVWMVLDLTRL
ncbi:MAG: GNAT family N-acetyltransferase [Flavobacterium sp.]